jgi:hypothetical protein
MIEHLKQPEQNPPLFERRAVLEGQSEETLMKWRDEALFEASELEKLVHEINDVMDGAGYEAHLIRGEN